MTTTSQHPLHRLIPSTTYANTYISREFDGVRDLDLIRNARRNRHNVLLAGPPGPGKTMMAYAAAAEANLPLVLIACNGAAEPRTFIGGWTPQPDGSFDFVPGDLVLAVMFGGIVLLDEFNALPPRIAVYVHSLLDDRRVISIPEASGSSWPTTITASDDFQIIATMNPEDRHGRPMSRATMDRWHHQEFVDYEPKIELKLTRSDALVEAAESLRERARVGDLSTPISTRALVNLEEFAIDEELGWDYALANFLRRFPAEERLVVTEVMRHYEPTIRVELGLDEAPTPVIDDDEPYPDPLDDEEGPF